MDATAFSLTTLEFDKVLGLLAAQTSFSAGRRRALGLVPSSDAAEVERLQQLTAEAIQLRELRPNEGLGGARDISETARRAGVGAILTPSELLEVQATVQVAARWNGTLAKVEQQLPALAELRFELSVHGVLATSIVNAIGEQGEVKDSASPALQRLRVELRTTHERLSARMREVIASATLRTLLQDPIITQRAGRYVVPVKAEYRSQFKGIVHDQSASGATLFMEPLAVVDMGNRLRELEMEEQREVERILRALSAAVGTQAEALARTVDTLAEIDLQLAKARLAEAMRASRPAIRSFGSPRISPTPPLPHSSTPVLRLVNARHPLLRGEVVPISIELGHDYDVVLITGPNTGGKTVALKTVGLLALMAQAGLQLPAEPDSQVAVFEAISADIGDEQSIEQSLSTFSSHVTRVVAMLRHAGPRSLVLLDELGAGTDPQEGAALARALLECLLERGVYCVATSHYPELKGFAVSTPRVQNASVEFDLETLSPTYRLTVGLPGRSNALEIAARLGMPEQVLQTARRYLSAEQREVEHLLAEVREERASAEAERERAQAAAKEQERLRRDLRAALADAERQRREAWQRAREESEALLSELRREVQRLREQMASVREWGSGGAGEWGKDAGTPRRELEEIVRRAERLQPLRAPEPAREEIPEPEEDEQETPLAVGAQVMVPSLGVVGTVLALDGNQVELEVHGRRVRMPLERLAGATRATRAQRQAASAVTERVYTPTVVREAPSQLDLRGKRRDEATMELDTYLHEAYMTGLRSVRIVHGRGTGAVRQAVHEVLARHSLVEDFSLAERGEGGEGATVVKLAV